DSEKFRSSRSPKPRRNGVSGGERIGKEAANPTQVQKDKPGHLPSFQEPSDERKKNGRTRESHAQILVLIRKDRYHTAGNIPLLSDSKSKLLSEWQRLCSQRFASSSASAATRTSKLMRRKKLRR